MMIENIILAQHAYFYTFDRLKLGFFIGLCIFHTFSNVTIRLRVINILLLVSASIFSVNSYRSSVLDFGGWVEMQDRNTRIARKTLNVENFEYASIFNDTIVRAYLNLLLHSSVNEYTPDASQINTLIAKSDCPVIIIHGHNKFRDIEEIISVDVYTRNGLEIIK
ncbi:hypothetical protein [Citrobacter sp. RHB35-C21]|uniref:hypothetical protein n=1 Tax=Citrobacter sp. RHB35-C21 TaxID=2742626 RepID=UPI0015EA6625|nr:hypothetical protein [Citrobacter sp. RHB35-C21]QMD51897.1 hypothetical protein HVZ39_07920 [Citrobacter sp. RHB35-C21]